MSQFVTIKRQLAAARGDVPADLLLTGGRVVNVFNGTIETIPVAISDGVIVGLGDYQAVETLDLHGAYLCPGFIDGHIHIESSKLTPPGFAETVVPHGTSAVVADPHEIANVLGLEGIRYMLESSQNLPLDFFYMLPSCVPATDKETSGANLRAEDLQTLLGEPGILGVAEVMNFPGVIFGDESLLAKIRLAGVSKPIDGHAPGVSGKQLAAYLTAGPATDHECFTLDEAREKLSRGMRIMIREGSTARNMEALLSLVTSETERRCMFVCDDKRPGDLLHQGHLDCVLQKAIRLGLDPVSAIRMVTLNPAESFGLKRRGGIAPGWVADLVAVNDLKELRVTAVWKAGKLVARDGAYLGTRRQDRFQFSGDRLKIPPVSEGQFQIKGGSGMIRVIEMVREQIITRSGTAEISPKDGYLESDPQRDLLKLAVIERHSGRGGMAMAFVKGMGLKKGALASTVAHDSHNIIAMGVDDVSLTSAVGRLVEMGGGQVAVCGKEVVAELPLPVAGLMTQKPAAEVAEAEESLLAAAKALGCSHSDPFMALSFLSLPVIPALRLTDKGLFDVGKFDHVPLFI